MAAMMMVMRRRRRRRKTVKGRMRMIMMLLMMIMITTMTTRTTSTTTTTTLPRRNFQFHNCLIAAGIDSTTNAHLETKQHENTCDTTQTLTQYVRVVPKDSLVLDCDGVEIALKLSVLRCCVLMFYFDRNHYTLSCPGKRLYTENKYVLVSRAD